VDIALFLHDVPPDLAPPRRCVGDGTSPPPPGSGPGPLAAWPKVPTRFLVCRDDRFFPAGFLHRVVQDRLGITADEIDGSHCVALSHPKELADRLVAYRVELQGTAGQQPTEGT
jgi:pimeloyl-ACP methyl ester carboxylesterase